MNISYLVNVIKSDPNNKIMETKVLKLKIHFFPLQ